MDKKWGWKMDRAYRAYEAAARDLGAEDLLGEVTVEDVEKLLCFSRVDRETLARNHLRRMREARNVGTTE